MTRFCWRLKERFAGVVSLIILEGVDRPQTRINTAFANRKTDENRTLVPGQKLAFWGSKIGVLGVKNWRFGGVKNWRF